MSQFLASSSTSKHPTTTGSTSNFNAIFDQALKAYKTKTRQDLTTHPLASQLQPCDSPAAILTILQDQVHQFEQSRSGDERLRRWLNPTINVLYSFSEALGEGVSLVFPPAKAIFVGAGVLLSAAKDVESSQDILIDVFERIENFFRRLEIYTNIPPTPAMTGMMVKIMVEVLDILGTATMEMKQSRFKKLLKKVAGITKLEDGLTKLDKMINEEVQMAHAEALRVAHVTHEEVEGVVTQVNDVDENVNLVKEMVQVAIDEGKEAATEAQLVMQQIAYNVDDANRRQLRESLRNWQSPSDPSKNYNIACGLQHEGTAEWFCEGNVFEEWKETGSLLWIHGKPGSGKSVLCSAMIKKITALYEAGSASMAYFYFDFRDVDKRSRHNLLPSLLVQLSARSDPFCDILSRLYESHDRARQPSDGALMGCLKEMLTLPGQGPVYLFLDALDECPNTSGVPPIREQVLDLVKYLVDLRLPSLHICATSRPEVDIRGTLEGLASHSVSLHDESGQEKDIAKYVKSVVHSNSARAIKRWRDADKELVIKTLLERADGMFRRVFCQLETLQHCLPQNISRALKDLPASLDEIYERVLKEIVPGNQHHTYRLLQCLAVASRPLRVQELAEILALDFDGAEEGIPELKEDWRWDDQKEAVLTTCSSLIAVVDDGPNRIVEFSHFSVKEFLTSDRLATSSAVISRFHIPLGPAHTLIAKASLGILLQSDNGLGDAKAGSRSPLAKYAAKHWVDHAQFGKVSRSVEDGMRQLFDLAKPHFASWVTLYDIDTPWFSFADYGRYMTRGSPLYYASLGGFRDLAAHLIDEHPQHVNARVGRKRSPLVAALHNKHFHVAELLRQNGANVGIRGDTDIENAMNPTLLHATSVDGLVDIGQWLLDHGEDATSQEANGNTPLHLAAKNGRIEFVWMLLRHGIVVNVKNKDDHTPLHLASQHGHVETMRLLLQHGADVTAKDRRKSTPLHWASFSDGGYFRENVSEASTAKGKAVQVLLEHGADVTAQDNSYSTPLHLASSNGYPENVRLLIEHGASVNALDWNRKTPLHLSYREVNQVETMAKTVQVLLAHGADVTARDDTHSTPLHLVSLNGSPEIARLLIEHGADVNALDGNRKTPLHLPSYWDDSYVGENYEEMDKAKTKTVQVLLAHGADVTARDRTYSTPLHLASLNGSPEIVRLLIEHGADVNALDGNRQTPLHLLSFGDKDSYVRKNNAEMDKARIKAVQVLLGHRADVTARDCTRSTPLHMASLDGSPEIARLLVEHGADVNALNWNRKTPLHLLSHWKGGHVRENNAEMDKARAKAVQVLLGHSADVTARDHTHSTPLHLASLDGSPEIARLLIEHGADVNALDENCRTPLHLPSFWGNTFFSKNRAETMTETVQVLFEHGADATTRDHGHSTPLHLASMNGSSEIVRLLIEHGADVNALDKYCKTPLHLASFWEHDYHRERQAEMMAETVQVLLEHGADVTARDDTRSTPLHLTSSMGSPEVVRLLIEHGTNVNVLDGNCMTPLHLASFCDDDYFRELYAERMSKIVQVLLEHGADVTARDDTLSVPLHLASLRGSPEIVRLLIEKGTNVNVLDGNCRTPLHLALFFRISSSRENHVEKSNAMAKITQVLLEHGADVTARDNTHTTPLHRASSCGIHKAVQLLIEHGAEIDALDGNCNTSLHLTVRDDFIVTARLLIEHGADVNARDADHSTPLHLASSFRRLETMRLLIEHGADINARDERDMTPLHLASYPDENLHAQCYWVKADAMAEIVQILIQHGADVTSRDGAHSTPLHLAASLAMTGDVVRLLLSNGASVGAEDHRGRTPFQIASSRGLSEIAELLSDV